ncbi:hypothetical protein FQN60_002342 [Etheostoma spectabile]|uniref:Uncharacterized protein n=1 Tax=Etheostoma spectabile TaxID=54343 RepID=A0A5J5DC81_9PERO|nr:hypothetical protein FQN60_002342 [Etheostoma spectabile]
MVYQEVWSNAAVGQQEREGWVGAEQKGEDSRAHTLPTPAPALLRGDFFQPGSEAQHAGNAAVTSRNFLDLRSRRGFRSLWATCMTVTMTASGAQLLLLALCVYRVSGLQQSSPRVRLSFKGACGGGFGAAGGHVTPVNE